MHSFHQIIYTLNRNLKESFIHWRHFDLLKSASMEFYIPHLFSWKHSGVLINLDNLAWNSFKKDHCEPQRCWYTPTQKRLKSFEMLNKNRFWFTASRLWAVSLIFHLLLWRLVNSLPHWIRAFQQQYSTIRAETLRMFWIFPPIIIILGQSHY